jgi:phospholipid/cholesterol/gamma-HCH transport system substrate-binding protein
VVSDRYVQLTPVYRGGPRMPDHGDIPVQRTATPVELDDIYRNLNDLDVSLGPKGANSNGALSRLLKVGADNLGGQGQQVNTTVHDLSTAVQTLSDNRKDLFGTVRNLQQFTTSLARSDQQVRQFNRDLAAVSEQLAGEKGELAAALHNLSLALAQVAAFVRDNKKDLTRNVAGLAEVTGVLVQQRAALAQFLDEAPLALGNLNLAYNPTSGTLDTRDNPLAFGLGLSRVLCDVLSKNQSVLTSLKLPKLNCAGLSPAALAQVLQTVRNRLAGVRLPAPAPGSPSGAPGSAGSATAPGPATGSGAPPTGGGGLLQPASPLDKTLGGILAVVR